ncbi:iron-sulfur cluster assembly scaffold protein SufB [Paratrimastix pyriformis]|uniref:Iron-sulfur cluster assembly scaffold protein SufB n=2 Tax=Paratrimastix pyriformis TaxID=342808 RepID=A0ABQ8UT31_9EUKA|nr:iron-sulfur cluster assembly scaffold protein SufB [Paratrimastix pyriformis]
MEPVVKLSTDELVLGDDETEIGVPVENPAAANKKGMIETFGIDKAEYEYGFETRVDDVDTVPPGLSEDIIRMISAKKEEPDWLLEFRLNAYRVWKTMKEPHWAYFEYPPIDYQALTYYSAPRSLAKNRPASLEEIEPEIRDAYNKLGIPLQEQEHLAGVAVDTVWDSLSVMTTFRSKLAKQGIIFCSISEAVREHPDLVRKYLASVVPVEDNFFTALNSAVFSDGSFCYIPPHTRCPMDLSTYFRINAAKTGQFERTLLIADVGATVSYLEGCTAPKRDENQLHAAVVELVALDNAMIKYSTVQNWYPGDKQGRGGIYNFVTKRGLCKGHHSHISWTQVETGSAITWKYPSCVLLGDYSVGEFHSVAVTNNAQQADTGTKMIHIGKHSRSTIVSKGISAGRSDNVFRGLVKVTRNAEGARSRSQCDSLLIGGRCGAHTFPTIESQNPTSECEHEASTSKVSEEQLFYCSQRGISPDDALCLIVNGFAGQVINQLPMEFAAEATKLLGVVLEGSTG